MKFRNRRLTFLGKIKNYIFSSFWITFSIVIAVSIFSNNPNDTSFNTVSTMDYFSNYLGRFGSYFSDLILQTFGYASIVFAFSFFVLGFNIFFNKVVYSKWQKFFAFVGLIISTSILFDIILNGENCKLEYCANLIGLFFVDSMYYMPQFLLAIISSIILFVSISFFLDIRKNWWIAKSARTYRLTKRILFGIFYIFVILIKILTTKNFRAKFKKFFIDLFNSKRGEFIILDEDSSANGSSHEEYHEDDDAKKNDSGGKLFGFLKKKEVKLETLSTVDVENEEVKKKIRENYKKINKKQNKYLLPEIGLLSKNTKNKITIPREELISQSNKLIKVLNDFGVKGDMLAAKAGPIITLLEFEPSAGTKSSRVIGLSDDIARSMSATSARISVIPGRNAMGIELPNKHRETIYIRDLIESMEYKNSKASLPMIIGSDISGEAIVADLAKMPHLLVAGTTGSGKSVAINTMITSLLYKMRPDQCKFIMIDPKMLELSVYEGIPHLLTPVVTEPLKAITALKWVCREMEDRYRIMASLGVRNIAGYNEKLNNAINSGGKLTRRVQMGFDSITDEPIYEERDIEEKEMPYIVVIVDEMADLMITAGKEIEASIQRIAQKARAAGIHIIMATQRPSVDVITGVIKANFPTRISFQVVSKIDSRTILGEQGAEQLLGMGDMLFMMGGGRIIRAHGPFVSDDEVEKVVDYIKSQGIEPTYVDEVLKNEDDVFSGGDSNSGDDDLFDGGGNEKDLYKQALAIVKKDKKCSISYIQRQLRIGYNRAANLVEEMEKNGVLSSPNNMGKREILIDSDE